MSHPFQSMSETKVTIEEDAKLDDLFNGERKVGEGKIEFMGSIKKPEPCVSTRITSSLILLRS